MELEKEHKEQARLISQLQNTSKQEKAYNDALQNEVSALKVESRTILADKS